MSIFTIVVVNIVVVNIVYIHYTVNSVNIIRFMLSLSFSCNKQHYLYYPIMISEYLLRYLLIIL